MITEDRVTFEIAKLLRDKGFPQNIEHNEWYVVKEFSTGCHWNSCTYKVGDITREYDEKCCIAMPTLQMAMKWLRELYHFHITVFSQSQESWMYRITGPGQMLKDGDYGEDFATYEEAANAAVEYCLEHKIIM